MKRKLVSYEVFAQLRENPLTNAVKELIEAEEHLARAIDTDTLKLSSFNDSQVIYEQNDGSYIQASYTLSEGKINFKNVEQLVIDEQSEQEKGKSILKDMLEAILDDKEIDAKGKFDEYITLSSKRYHRDCEVCSESVMEEGYARLYGSAERTKGKSLPKISYRSGSKDKKRSEAAKLGHKRHQSSYLRGVHKRKRNLNKERARRKRYAGVRNRLHVLNAGKNYNFKKKMTEWNTLSGNVLTYLDFSQNGHVLSETVVTDSSVSIPDSKTRSEAKVLKMHNDHLLKTDVKILRENAKRLSFDQKFCQAIAEIKRYNNISDANQLEESINKLIQKYPVVLYVTESELAKTISLSLASVGITNYDDDICKFLSEGVLRGAHHIYSERVERIMKLAKKEVQTEDSYADFQKAVDDLYAKLDESFQLEMKMFEDLYNATVEVHKIATESKNDTVKMEAQDFISELQGVLEGKTIASMDLASDVAFWIESLVESNWEVEKEPYHTVSGDHPILSKYAKVPGHPDSMFGYEGGIPTASGDDKNLNHDKEMQLHGFSNIGGKDVYPDLNNPYLLEPFKGNKEEEDGLGNWQSDETSPNLKNPYLLPAWMPKQLLDPKNGVN